MHTCGSLPLLNWLSGRLKLLAHSRRTESACQQRISVQQDDAFLQLVICCCLSAAISQCGVCHGTGEEKCVYSSFGASCSEVEVNVLTGERRVLRADIMMDAGNSLSPAIDAGQVCAHAC